MYQERIYLLVTDVGDRSMILMTETIMLLIFYSKIGHQFLKLSISNWHINLVTNIFGYPIRHQQHFLIEQSNVGPPLLELISERVLFLIGMTLLNCSQTDFQLG